MSSYEAFKERQKNASPYANEAVCIKCKYCERINRAWCNGFGRPRRLSEKSYWSNEVGYCTQYYPRQKEGEQNAAN